MKATFRFVASAVLATFLFYQAPGVIQSSAEVLRVQAYNIMPMAMR